MKIWLSGLVCCCLAFSSITAQNALRIGEWRMHLPYRNGLSVTQSDTRIFYGTESALLSINKDSIDDVRFYSKIDGLNDVKVTNIKYHHSEEVLIVVYENSNIDLIYNQGIANVDNILTNNTIIGSKTINDVFVDETSKVYFSCDFGLVEFDLATGKFGFTMFTGTPVRGYTEYNGFLYIATGEGLFRFDPASGGIVSNFGAWSFMGVESGLPAKYSAQDVAIYQGALFCGAGNALYLLEGDQFTFWDDVDGKSINFISPEGAHLKVGYVCADKSCGGQIGFYTLDGYISDNGYECVFYPTYVIEDEQGRVWYADETDGIRYAENFLWGCEYLEFNTPYSGNVSEIAIKDNVVYVASGGVSDIYNYLLRRDGYFIFQDDIWSYQNSTNNDQLAEYDPVDYFRILPHTNPDSQIVYIGTYYSGLLEYHVEDSLYTFYDQDNSALQGAEGDIQRARVSGLAMDIAGNLWITNYLAPRPIVVKMTDGTWLNFSAPSNNTLGQIVIDNRGYKWIAIVSNSEGILVFDDRGTIDNTTDDRYRVLRTTNSNLPTNALTNLVVDRSGDIWVGTSEGPVVFDGAADPFTGDNQGYRVVVDQDGTLSYLLGDEQVNTIAIDGANRKWIGTNNGVFVQSPDGKDEVAIYNVDNSPLLSNSIIDIAINPYDGEVFIGTSAGIVSTRTDAIEGTTRNLSSAYAFPNPVAPDYDGPIAIRGLAEDAAVKITDISGVVVYETRALGGQAIWDGKDSTGKRARSGVYLVFSTTESEFDKPDALVTKVLVVN